MAHGRIKLRVLKALLAFLGEMGMSECKTIGNGHPEGLHCFTCTFNDLHWRVKRAVDFWREGDRSDKALS